MSDKEEILEDLKDFGISEILAQFMMNDDAKEIVNDYIRELERQIEREKKERWKTAKNLFNCRKKIKEIKILLGVKIL